MAEQDSKNLGAIITALIAIFGASWLLQSTPNSSRPKLNGSAPQVLSSAQDVPARLWQDPVRVAMEHYNQALWSLDKDKPVDSRSDDRLKRLLTWMKPARDQNNSDPKASVQENAKGANAVQNPNANIAQGAHGKKTKPPKSLYLIVMVPGGSAPERSELRLRIRQAVIYALASERYRPKQGDNIGYFQVSVPLSEPLTSEQPAAGCVSNSSAESEKTDPSKYGRLLIPFESFEQPLPQPPSSNPATEEEDPRLNRFCEKATVLWLCDDVPGATAYQLLWQTARAVGCVTDNGEYEKDYGLRVLGPSSSQVLQELWSDGGKIQEREKEKVEKDLCSQERFFKNLTITSPFATMDSAAIQAFRLGPENRLAIPKVERTVQDDYAVCSELVNELARRNVIIYGSGSPGPGTAQSKPWQTGHIALLSEWDTFYGRVLPFTFRRALANHPAIFANKRITDEAVGGPDPVQIAEDPVKQYHSLLSNSTWPQGVESFFYLRGLDGRPPTDDRPQPNPANLTQTGATSGERLATEGESQADFVERLAGQLARRHDQLIREGHGGFRAIGVLGSDVYDKLMLLRALRSHFRGVVFFTNDIDARFTLPEETQTCRNLVIASPYGLNLKADYQHTIPQFRSSTQTAVFAAMLHVLGGVDVATTHDPSQSQHNQYQARPRDLGTIRLFEIGLRGPVDLTIPKLTGDWPLAGKSGGLIHPERFAVRGVFDGGSAHRFALTSMFALLGILSVTLLIGFYNSELARVTVWPTKEPNKPKDEAAEAPAGGKPKAEAAKHDKQEESEKGEGLIRLLGRQWVGFFVPLVVSLSCYIWFMAHASPDGEPFTLLDGTSSWQTFGVMTFAALFCMHLICRTELILHENDEALVHEFDLKNESPQGEGGGNHPHWLANVLRRFGKKKRAIKVAKKVDEILDWVFVRWHGTPEAKGSRLETASANDLWLRYRFLGRFPYRVFRASALTAIAFGGIWIAFQFYPPPPLPFRSPDGPPLVAIAAALGTFFFSTLLLFVVSDAVVLSCGLIRRLDRGRTVWPARENRDLGQNPTPEERCRNWRDRILDERSDIRFIEKRTRAVGRITHYPFFMVALIFVARNRYFDDWAMPLGVIVTYVLLLGITIALSSWLNGRARAARAGSLDRLGELKTEIESHCFDNPNPPPSLAPLSDQLDNIRKEIKGMKEGSYAPFWDQPAFRGILLGTGGWSLSTLLPQLSNLF